MNIPLSSPDIIQKDIDAVVRVLRSGQLSLGPKLEEFEAKFAKYIGAKHAVALNSGTSALHLCIKALGIGKGDEVITTPFSFIASSNCILFEGAQPVFVDIRKDTLNIDESKIEAKITNKTKAILPVHIFGYPVDMEKIVKVARKYKLAVIEDACEALGARIHHKKIGAFGDLAVFAFYPNKQITTGEGGMLVTNNANLAKLIKSYRNQGRDTMEWLAHNRIGYNYRLSDINCALGISQLQRIDKLLAKREYIAKLYLEELSDVNEIILPPSSDLRYQRSWFVFVVRLSDRYTRENRDELIALLKKDGVVCGAYFPAIHLQPFYRREFDCKEGDFKTTEAVSRATIALPFYNRLERKQVKYIVSRLKLNLKRIK